MEKSGFFSPTHHQWFNFSVEQNTPWNSFTPHLVLFLVDDDCLFSFSSCSSLSETVLNLSLGFGAATFSVLSDKKAWSSSCKASVWCRDISIKFYGLYFIETNIFIKNTQQYVHIILIFRRCRYIKPKIKHCLRKQADDGSFELCK